MSRAKPHIFLIDNFDSFTFNLAYEFQVAGCEVEVWRNNIPVDKALELIAHLPKPNLVVMSPGPGTPYEAGCCMDLVKRSKGAFPIFGVCLGHQAIVEAFGGKVEGAGRIVHGKTSAVAHDGEGLFKGLPNPMAIARYHSLAATHLPPELIATASAGDVNMAVKHRDLPIVGVQFHPESILTTHGSLIIANVIQWAGAL
jgi:anthranilate synthase component 2